MSKLKFINFILLGLVTCGNVAPILSASEVSDELSETISESIIEESSLLNESEQVDEESEQVVEESEQVVEESEQVVEESEQVEEESEQVVEESEQVVEESEQVEEESEQVVEESEQVVASSRSSKFTGWKDKRSNGKGYRYYYNNGVLTKDIYYENNIIVNRSWYHSNGKVRVYREYNYNSKTKEYMTKREYTYNTEGRYTDFKSWHDSGYLQTDFDYKSTGGRIIKRQYFYSNGKTKELRLYTNSGIYKDRKYYFSNGKIKQDFNYYSDGTRRNSREYSSSGDLLFYRGYYSNGSIEFSQKYDSNGNETRKNEYDKNNNLIKQIYTYTNGTQKLVKTYNTAGTLIKLVERASNGNYTLYRTYYSNGKNKEYYTYHSNGKAKNKKSYYSNGQLKIHEYYNSAGVKRSYKTWYSNGAKDQVISYYSNGKVEYKDSYNTSDKRIAYKSYYENGRLYRDYPAYYSNQIPVYRMTYKYHSNGIVKSIQRLDYTFRSEKSYMTETYNSSGRQIGESVSSPSATGYFKIPMEGYITCQYECYSNHTGVDLGNTNKTQAIYSTAPGTVVQVSGGCSNSGYLGNSCNYGAGNYVVIKHTYKGKQYFSIYMHLSSIDVKVGQTVKYTTKIGNMGSSGNSSGAHLHFEVFEDTDKDGLRSDEYRTNPAIHVDFSSREIKVY